MEILFFILGTAIGGILVYFILKSNSINRAEYDDLNKNLIKKETELSNALSKISELNHTNNKQSLEINQLTINIQNIKENLAKTSIELKSKEDIANDLKNQIQKLNTSMENISSEKEKLFAKNAELYAINDSLKTSLQNQKEEITQLQENTKLQFENIANKILEEKTEKFTAFNQENIKNILSPLQEKISNFEKKVEDTHKESINHHSALRQQILGLKDLNLQMSKDALNLTRALKGDNKKQGNWGELILSKVLEKSGLEKGREYDVQKNHSTEEGRFQPDVIINLPDGKKMIIDSKVSLNAYEKFAYEDDFELKKSYLKEHIFSINKHIEQLSNKNYQSLYEIESPDFVLLFIPIEPAFAEALNEDQQLYNRAFEKNIVIVTPSTLLATLKTIDSMWANQKRQENATQIAKQAGALYDKFEGLLTDLINIGKKLDSTKSDYEKAMNKLHSGKGNLIKSIEKLKIMGARANKNIPENLILRANNDDESE